MNQKAALFEDIGSTSQFPSNIGSPLPFISYGGSLFPYGKYARNRVDVQCEIPSLDVYISF